MKDNWYALIIAIIKNVTPEIAFEMMGRANIYNFIHNITPNINFDMMVLKGFRTNKDIGKIYRISDKAVSMRVARSRKKKRDILNHYLDLSEKLYRQGFSIKEVVDLITDIAKKERMSEVLKAM